VKIRFLADADLKFQIVVAVRHSEPAVDFQSANEAGLKTLKDPQVLSYAAREGRMLVTHDRSTMPGHFVSFIKTRQSPGLIVISQQLAITAVAHDLILMWAASEPEEWINQITFLPM
jgi:predicted nuclease of predicted toxin-antitoxin system